MTFIYYLTKLNEDVPFYVGKTVNIYSRTFYHKIKYGENFKMVIIDKVKNKEWKFWEKHYISLYKSWGFKLDNKNDGGGGTTKASQETKNKISKSKSKPILQYDLQGNFIREWESGKQFAIENNLTNGTSLTKCAKFKIHSAYNFIWRYKTKNYKLKIDPIKRNFETKPIIQYDLNMHIVKKWDSILEAADNLNFKKQNICNNLKNRSKHAYNFIWKYQ